MDMLPASFKANDIRGRVGRDIDAKLVRDVARAFAEELPEGSRVVLGRDARLESPEFAAAAAEGLTDSGIDVTDLGLCGTEEVYFHTAFGDSAPGRSADCAAASGVMITASHNPAGYNGMKLVRSGSRPVGVESGLREIGLRALSGGFRKASRKGLVREYRDKSAYVEKILSFVNVDRLEPFRILADAGNGAAGPTLKALASRLPFDMRIVNGEPDGMFPLGAPDPMKPAQNRRTSRAVLDSGADFGVAWDGDFDRCFLFDSSGRFVDGYYLVGMLGETLAARAPGAKIVYDRCLVWNTIARVAAAGGLPLAERTGHVFMKERMRAEGAIYGGESSSHHFFRDFAYCDSGMIPWLLAAELMSTRKLTLAGLVGEAMDAFPASGGLSYEMPDPAAALARLRLEFEGARGALVDTSDGLSVEFPTWRFNARVSNTESLLRLVVETRGDRDAIPEHVRRLESSIESFRGARSSSA